MYYLVRKKYWDKVIKIFFNHPNLSVIKKLNNVYACIYGVETKRINDPVRKHTDNPGQALFLILPL